MFSFRCPKDVAKNDSKPKSIPIALPNGIGYRLTAHVVLVIKYRIFI
jgi:hypothetical protein